MPKENNSINLMRHQLGSIDLDDIEERIISEAERNDYCAAIAAVWPRIERDIKRLLHTQLMFISNEAQNWDQVLFGRGTFNGMDLLLEYWKEAYVEHKNKNSDIEKFDKHSPIAEV